MKKIIIYKDDKNIIKLTKPMKITIIQILEDDDILKYKNLFLIPDFNFKNGYEFYQNKNIYLVQPKKEDKNNNKDNLEQIKTINIPYFDYSSDALN